MKVKLVLSTLYTLCDIFIFCVLDMCNTFFFGLHFGLLRCYANVGKVRNARKAFRVARLAADIQYSERKRKEERG